MDVLNGVVFFTSVFVKSFKYDTSKTTILSTTVPLITEHLKYVLPSLTHHQVPLPSAHHPVRKKLTQQSLHLPDNVISS